MNFRIRVFSKSTCKTSFDSFGSLLGWYNFTTLRATGKNGPVSAAGYKGTLLQEVHVLNGVQEWQVPITGKYSVEACGASGGDGILTKKGGKGAKVSGVITLSKGDKLAILVGQKGSTQDKSHPGSGGGATFVYRSPNKHDLILVAGGGGGGGKEDGLPGNDSPDGSGSVDTRGTNGGGGKVCRDANLIPHSGAGAGYLNNGGCLEDGKYCGAVHCSKGGISLGKGGESTMNCDGGFGGGGACDNFPGGGGGYSGGGVASDKVAGGGGSYKPDDTWEVTKGGCEDDGYVSFTAED